MKLLQFLTTFAHVIYIFAQVFLYLRGLDKFPGFSSVPHDSIPIVRAVYLQT